jgi:hypothetical protein
VDIIRVIKSGRMKWAVYVAHMGVIIPYKILIGRREEKSPLGDQVVDGRIILESILWEQGGIIWTGFIWLRTGTSGGLL